MGFLSCNSESSIITCNSESSIITCDPYNTRANPIKTHKKKNIRRFSCLDLESSTGNFSPHCFLGKGSHGRVYKAVIDDGKLIVAVKRTTLEGTNEIDILSKIRSPFLVNLIGFSFDLEKNDKLLVFEFMANGSLFDLLHSNPRPPRWSKRLRFALQVAKAVETLHLLNPPVIHRDIKSSNVLIDGNWNARLSDFGLALRGYVEDVKMRCMPPAGTLGYLDPGYITPENLSAKMDVFSFGILLLEIVSGRNAIDVNCSPPSVVDWALPLIKRGEFVSILDPRIRPPENLSGLEWIAIMAARCVRSRVEKRPSMVEVVDGLRFVNKKRVSSPIWNNLKRQTKKPIIEINKELFDGGEEFVKTLKHSRKVSNFRYRRVQPSVDMENEEIVEVGVRVGRSSSIGSISEIKVGSHTDGIHRKSGGLVVRVPSARLNKSRSMGVLRSTRPVHGSEREAAFYLMKNPQLRGFDMSKLAINVDSGCKEKRKPRSSII
ncbi:hypothetical protein GIB67_006452 [Kingdonia uniflora]|uniref:Protein kinase domain-containing protein n=1 Tax=Kingdonia uniflora TaxID=39325 RepID=A0A7J7NF08_9MAGN|nr:hypothetical protein GIB67_006452 [Kingdonia uniflora]